MFSTMRAYPVWFVDEFTHTETENALPSEIVGVTTSLDPLKLSAELILPAVHVGPLTVALSPLPEVSCATVPLFSSKFQYPIRPAVGGPVTVLLTVILIGADVADVL